MPAGRHFLQIPGPTNVPDRILRAIDRPTIDHRGPEFQSLGKDVLEGIRRIFKTRHPVVMVVEFEEPVFAPSFLFVTTRHGLPLTMTVPSDPEVTATLSARTGAAAARNPMVRMKRAPLLWIRIRESSEKIANAVPSPPVAVARR